MDLIIEKLNERHLPMVNVFSCVETEEQLQKYNSSKRRFVRKHSKEMDDFLQNEALLEQNKGLNTTHLFIDKDSQSIIAYLSLCNDALRLEFDERDKLGIRYSTVPAMKIARLAVATSYQGNGIGKQLIKFAAYMAERIKHISGVSFITVDCYEHRMSYYENEGFVPNELQDIQKKFDVPISMRLSLEDYLSKLGEISILDKSE